jgi:pheromone shutdown-related protein TraB
MSHLAHQQEISEQSEFKIFPSTRLIEDGDRKIYLIGTAHISAKSVEEVKQTIEALKPDSVCVELCQTRYDGMMDENRWKKLDIFQVVKQGKFLYLLANLALSAYQRVLGEKFGVKPGEEQRQAIRSAESTGSKLVLADRSVEATLKRTWANLSFWSKSKLLASLFSGGDQEEELTEEKLEQMKDQDTITELMKSFAEEMPQIKEPLIDERDAYLMASIARAPGKVIVGVVGAGHVHGMLQQYEKVESIDLNRLSELPPPSPVGKIIGWLIPIILVASLFWGYQSHGMKSVQDMLIAWILPTSTLCALFTLLAGPKPLSVLVAALCAPITTIHPAISAGMVVGLAEAWYRKPTVEDCENVTLDAASIKGLYHNPITRVLLVALASNLGAALGFYVGISWVLKLTAN